MSKAEERALEAYPVFMTTLIPADEEHPLIEQDCNKFTRKAYLEGYHQAEKDLTDRAKVSSGWDGFYYGQGYKQAEKDLELTWEDIRELYIIFAEVDTEIELCKTDIKTDTLGYYKEVLKRFKDLKDVKQKI